MQHSVGGDTLADILERVLDKGVVIAEDIKMKPVDVSAFSSKAQSEEKRSEIARLKEQVGGPKSRL